MTNSPEASKLLSSETPKVTSEALNTDKINSVLKIFWLGEEVEKDGTKKDTKAETSDLLWSIFGNNFTDLMSKEFKFLGTTLTLGGLLGISAKKTESTESTQSAPVVITPEGEKFLQENPKLLGQIDTELQTVKDTPITAQMVVNASTKHQISSSLLLAFMKNDSTYGTKGIAVATRNPGNIGNTDDKRTKTFATWEEGVDGCAEHLASRVKEFHAVYGDSVEPTALMLATNQWPDGKWFLAKQANYQKENTERKGAYMTAKNGPETVQKFADDIEKKFLV